MADVFVVDGEEFQVQTVPGAARCRIVKAATKEFVGAFDPCAEGLLNNKGYQGQWVGVVSSADTDLLGAIELYVKEVCRQRLLWFRKQLTASSIL